MEIVRPLKHVTQTSWRRKIRTELEKKIRGKSQTLLFSRRARVAHTYATTNELTQDKNGMNDVGGIAHKVCAVVIAVHLETLERIIDCANSFLVTTVI